MMSGVENIPIGDRSLGNVVPLSGSATSSTHPDDFDTAGSDAKGPEALGSEPGSAQLAWMAEESLRIGIGFASAVATALARAFEGLRPASAVDDEPGGHPTIGPSHVALAAGAAAGLTIEVATAAIRAGESVGEVARPLLSWFAVPPALLGAVTTVEGKASDLNDTWSHARGPSEAAAAAFARELIPEIANALLDQIDLTQLVVDRVDVGRIVSSIDMGRIIAEIPMDEIIARIDINAIVAGVDVNAIVERVDLNEIAGRIDLDAIVHRLDLGAIASEVITEIDLSQIIRESSGTMATETVEGVRLQTMDADRLLARVVDRMLLRKTERDTDVASEVPHQSSGSVDGVT